MRAKEFITESTGQIIGPFKLIDVNNSVVTVEGHEPLKLSASVRDRLRSGYNYAFDIVNGEVAKVILMVVDAVIYTDTEVLLIKRKGEPYAGHWALPGGFVEPGESVADAAKRELQEETGLVVNNVQPVGEFKTPNRDPRMENTWSYAFKLHLKDRGIVHAGDDASAASWIPREQLSKLPLAFDHSAILAKALTLDEQIQPELTNGEGFEHTVDRNGITLKAASNGHGALQIKAFVQGKKAGEAYFEMTPDNQHIASDDTHVDQRFRRTGIATVMYQYAKELGNSIAPSPDRTDDGNAMWLGFMRKNSMVESLDAPYPLRWNNNGSYDSAVFKLANGRSGSVTFQTKNENAPVHVAFTVDNTAEVSGGGDEQRIFATAIHAIREWLSQNSPLLIEFTAKPANRFRLYQTMVRRYANSFGYQQIPSNKPNTFTLIKKTTMAPGQPTPPPLNELEENFADGRNPEDQGDSARHGIPKGATMAQLERASHAKGRKGQLARWQLNMRRGKKK